jgi:hypothetical protein
MGLLAYDPSRLESLRAALRGALDDLAGVRSDDPLAADANATVIGARRALGDLCLQRVTDILNADPMGSYHKAKVNGNDIRQTLIYTMRDSYGWKVATDPLDDDALQVTAAEARALGFRLQHGNLNKLTDTPEEVAFIAGQLAIINADPQLRAEFLANMTDLAELADKLGRDRIDEVSTLLWEGYDPPVSARVAAIDAAIEQLSHVYQARPGTANHAAPYPTWVSEVEPFTAALLLRYANLDPMTLGFVANDLLVRWRNTRPDDEGRDESAWTDLNVEQGPKTADILFQLMLDTPGATTVYVKEAANDPFSMWMSASDYRLAQRVALQGTDPANMTAADSAAVLKSFIEFAGSSQYRDFGGSPYLLHPTDYPTFLGSLVAPWLRQFSVDSLDWDSLKTDDRDALLTAVLKDKGALGILVASLHDTVDTLKAEVDQQGLTKQTAKEFSGLIGMLGQLIVDQKFCNEQEREEAWNSVWGLAGDGLGFLPVPAVVGLAINKALGKAQELVADKGWLAAPEPDRVKDKEQYKFEWMVTVTTATMAITIYDQLGLPGDHRPPEPDPTQSEPMAQYEHDFNEWLNSADVVVLGPGIDTIDQWKELFIDPFAAGASLGGT